MSPASMASARGRISGTRQTQKPSGRSGYPMPRYKPRVKAGPNLSHEARDKLMAWLVWWIGRDKKREAGRRDPHRIDIPVPLFGMGGRLNDMRAWCAEHSAGQWEQHGTTDPS